MRLEFEVKNGKIDYMLFGTLRVRDVDNKEGGHAY